MTRRKDHQQESKPQPHRIDVFLRDEDSTTFVVRCACGKRFVRMTGVDALAAHERHAAHSPKVGA